MSIMLNDLLHLSPEEIKNAKITLNMNTKSERPIDSWLNFGRVNYSVWSHQGKRRNYYIGTKQFGFVQLGNNLWLFVLGAEITNVPALTVEKPKGDYCDYKIIEKYEPYMGRLIVRIKKGNKQGRYAFNMSKFIHEAEVVQVLQEQYGKRPYPGHENLILNFIELKRLIDLEEWKAALSSVYGIYLITDTSNGKRYVGAAYGEGGIYGRWKNYLESGYDSEEMEEGRKFPNSQLKKIATDKMKGMAYIEKNFAFSILEALPKKLDISKVIEREKHWKEVLMTTNSPYGYNSN